VPVNFFNNLVTNNPFNEIMLGLLNRPISFIEIGVILFVVWRVYGCIKGSQAEQLLKDRELKLKGIINAPNGMLFEKENNRIDIVSFSENLGGSVIDWAVIDIFGQDDGMWHLLVQK